MLKMRLTSPWRLLALIATTAVMCLGFSVACTAFPDLDSPESRFDAEADSSGNPISVAMKFDYSNWEVDKVVVEATWGNGGRQTLFLYRDRNGLVGELGGLPLDTDITISECWWKWFPRCWGCTDGYTVHTPSA